MESNGSLWFVGNSSLNATNSTDGTKASQQEQILLEIQLVCYSIIALISIIGNALIWWRVLNRRRRRISDYFIMNLALSDILVGLISIPLDLTERLSDGWPFWGFMCKVVYPLQTVLMAVSVLTLLCISIERYKAVVTPLKRKPSRRVIITVIISLWGASFLVAIPYMTVLQFADHLNQCNENWPSGAHVAIYTVCMFLFLYVAPLCLITVCYIRVGMHLKREVENLHSIIKRCSGNLHMKNILTTRHTNNMRICKVFIAVVLVFALFHLPNHVMYLWLDLGNGGKWPYFSDVLPLCHILTYLNSAADPFILGTLECRCWSRKPATYKWRRRRLRNVRNGRRESKSNRVLLKASTKSDSSDKEMINEEHLNRMKLENCLKGIVINESTV